MVHVKIYMPRLLAVRRISEGGVGHVSHERGEDGQFETVLGEDDDGLEESRLVDLGGTREGRSPTDYLNLGG